MSTWYAVVTFGYPNVRFCRTTKNFAKACEEASRIKGQGSCSAAGVLACPTRKMAMNADIGDNQAPVFVV